MPPRAIASAVRATTSNTARSPVRSQCRNSPSISADGGNFGAPPNPPCSASSSRSTAATAWASSSGVIASSASGRPAAWSRSAAATCADAWFTSSRRVRQVSVIAVSNWVNDGMPPRGSFG